MYLILISVHISVICSLSYRLSFRHLISILVFSVYFCIFAILNISVLRYHDINQDPYTRFFVYIIYYCFIMSGIYYSVCPCHEISVILNSIQFEHSIEMTFSYIIHQQNIVLKISLYYKNICFEPINMLLLL